VPSQDENENSHVDQDQAENEVERRVEVRLGRERDRASEQHGGDDDHERGEDHAGGVAHPCSTTLGTGEEHGLLRQHDGADRSAQPERDDDRERRQHEGTIGLGLQAWARAELEALEYAARDRTPLAPTGDDGPSRMLLELRRPVAERHG
jgi:hypothetical protein